jgi:hypothetical protein
MAKDKIKLLIILKSSFVIFYFFYAGVMSTQDSNVKKITDMNMTQKNFLLGEVCLSILGGSNVKWGISAELLSSQNCVVKNYGVDYEGGSFESYSGWFSKGLNSKSVIYSSYLVLAEKVNYQDVDQFRVFPSKSILSEIFSLLPRSSNTFNYNSFGDLIEYNCLASIKPFTFNAHDFMENNKVVALEMKRRLELIDDLGKAKVFFVRIPPVYVSESKIELYKSLIENRIDVFRGLGINVISSTYASSDSSLFCDAAHHPNAKGRNFFTNEIKEIMRILP